MNLNVIRNKNFILVFLGKVVSEFGTYLQSFALSLYVLDKTGSAALFSTVIVVSMIPRIILMPFAGVLSDRFSRKKMIVNMDILSGLFVLTMSGIFLINNDLSLAMIYIIVIVLNTINVFFSPSMNSIMPDIVEKDKLADANSFMEMGGAIIALTAPIVAGVLFSSFGILPIMIVNSISFLLSAASESFIKIKKESIVSKEDHEGFMESFKAGLSYLKSMPEFIILIAVTVIANFALGPIFSVALPIVVLKDFGLSEATYGLIASLMTIGMFIGPLFAAGIIKRFHYSRLVSSILSIGGIICLLIALSCVKGIFPNIRYNTIIMVVLINILMITVIWVNLSITTARQKIVPGHLQGRVVSVVGMFAMIAMPLGQLLMGFLLDNGKSYIIIGLFAIVVFVSGLFAKIGFSKLARSGKMDITLGVEKAINEEAAEIETI